MAASLEPAPYGLMCDLLARPELTEIMNARPRLSWIMRSNDKNIVQSAYEIRVTPADSATAGHQPFLWDSGKVRSDHSTAVTYAGSPLSSHHAYLWQVRTWDQHDRNSEWSEAQRFQTGALRSETAAPTGDDRITVTCYPLQTTPVAPVRITAQSDGAYLLDFGRDAFGALMLNLTSPADGRAVTVRMGEVLTDSGHVSRAPGGSRRFQETVLTLRKGKNAYVIPLNEKDGRRMPQEVGRVMPFRYAEIENAPGPITTESAWQITAHYLFDYTAARFHCSDPKLNAIWDLCHYTMKATSFCGIFVDGDRERLPYEADAYINQLGYYAADREYTISRYSHEHLILHPTWPTEWQSHSVMMAWADYLATGDDRSLAEFYTDLKAKTLHGLARPDGLISTVEPPMPPDVLASLHIANIRDIVDWPMSERDGYEMLPVNTVVNAFYYHSLVLMAQIAEAQGQTADAATYREAAKRTAQSFQAKFFDRETGLYVDGEGSRHSSQHANMFALAFGLVPPENRERIAAFVASRGMACSVYAAQYLLEALYDTGQAETARALMTAPNDRSWTHMVEDVGTTITLEAWDDKYKPNQDWNHAWGAAPANILPRKLMGIEPLEPAFRRIQIHPRPGGLTNASLDLPTIRGTIHEDFESSSTRFALNLQLPANTSARVVLPRLGSESTRVIVDGVPQEGRIEGDSVVLESVGSGKHTLMRTR